MPNGKSGYACESCGAPLNVMLPGHGQHKTNCPKQLSRLAKALSDAAGQAVADILGKSEGREEGWGIWADAVRGSIEEVLRVELDPSPLPSPPTPEGYDHESQRTILANHLSTRMGVPSSDDMVKSLNDAGYFLVRLGDRSPLPSPTDRARTFAEAYQMGRRDGATEAIPSAPVPSPQEPSEGGE
jgi:hypothetical protein